MERGIVTIQAPHPHPGAGSRIALLLFPGDMFLREVVPPMGTASVAAATEAAIRRTRLVVGNCETVSGGLARLVARLAMHALMLRELTAEQRLATFLLEFALRCGHSTPAGCSFEMPLSRKDVAYYLALNPDTMSRLMSRLKAKRLIATPSRRWVTVPSLTALAAVTPLAAGLRRFSPTAEGGALLDWPADDDTGGPAATK